ncbi:hypothetical protein BD309DRAFT_958985 [Dichomitus squalens]|nr:hypothetical protein BD309DRAFT_958985 [Dichomitus squalens]
MMAQIAPFAFEADEKVCKLYVEQLQDVVNGGDYMPMETTFSEEDDPSDDDKSEFRIMTTGPSLEERRKSQKIWGSM